MKKLLKHKIVITIFLVLCIGIIGTIVFFGKDLQFYFESRSKQYIDYEAYIEDRKFYEKQIQNLSDMMIRYMDLYSSGQLSDEELERFLRVNSQDMNVVIKAASDLRKNYKINPESDINDVVLSYDRKKNKNLKIIFVNEMKELLEVLKPNVQDGYITQFTAFAMAGGGGMNSKSSSTSYPDGTLTSTRYSDGTHVHTFQSNNGSSSTWGTDKAGNVTSGNPPEQFRGKNG